MNRINRLKYTGVIAGVGLAVVLLSSGAYANTGSKDAQQESETELEVIALELSDDLSENHFDIIQTDVQEPETNSSVTEEDGMLSAGAGGRPHSP